MRILVHSIPTCWQSNCDLFDFRFEDMLLVLEILGFAAPARGPELLSQKSYTIGDLPHQLASFEPFVLTSPSGQVQHVLASRIYINKTTHKDGSNSKVITRLALPINLLLFLLFRPLTPDATFFLLHLVRVLQPFRALLHFQTHRLFRQPVRPENWEIVNNYRIAAASTFAGRDVDEKCGTVWARVTKELDSKRFLKFSHWRHWMVGLCLWT